MPDAPPDTPPPPPAADPDAPVQAAAWLAGLLDAARGAGDAPLARLVADLMDDLKAAKG